MKIDPSTHEPIIFRTQSPIRFTDVDRYGHVATAHYIEYLFTSRFDYLREKFGVLPENFIKEGVGFVTRRMQFEFVRPIPASQTHVAIESWVSLAEDAKFVVDFKIHHPGGEPVHANGQVEFRVIGLKDGAQRPVPDWLLAKFFDMSGKPAGA